MKSINILEFPDDKLFHLDNNVHHQNNIDPKQNKKISLLIKSIRISLIYILIRTTSRGVSIG